MKATLQFGGRACYAFVDKHRPGQVFELAKVRNYAAEIDVFKRTLSLDQSESNPGYVPYDWSGVGYACGMNSVGYLLVRKAVRKALSCWGVSNAERLGKIS